jgi:hypothetical protein
MMGKGCLFLRESNSKLGLFERGIGGEWLRNPLGKVSGTEMIGFFS